MSSHRSLAQLFRQTLHFQSTMLAQQCVDPAAHPVIAADEPDESRLVCGVLPAVCEDQETVFAVVALLTLIRLVE